ncbi:hypothetical protein MMC19_007371 [Ptychographa xylographoides]|nr:hypothetical protein [Ptychographa xylographoides]
MSGRFRVRSIETTYCLIGNHGLSTSILGVNKQIHREGCHVLYSSHVFDFDKNVESIIPFFGDLTPIALLSVRRISIVQRALPYIKEFDRCEWRSVCKFIARNLELDHLVLGVLGGVPESRWVVEDPIEKTAFRHITRIEGMEWVTELAAIKGLRNLDVKAYMEHCPPPQSIAMAFFVNFSASIETGFAEYLRELMIIASA